MSPIKTKRKSEIILELLKKRSEKGLEFARRTILTEEVVCGKMHEALEYYTLNWENFTHPGLFSIACEAVSGNSDEAVEVQAALAMIAAALDVHDDIIDKSRIKHGKQTVFGKFGQDMTLILGDVFFVSGFTLLGETLAKLPEEKTEKIFATLRRTLLELGSAHALELDLKKRMSIPAEEYMKILKMKAASVESDMRIGAIVGGGTNSEIETLTKYGRTLGILATLREEFIDIFDIKELSQRMRKECLPIPILYSMQNRKANERLKKLFAKKKITSKDVNELVDIVFKTRNVRKLKKMMKDLIEESNRLISKIKDIRMKDILSNLVESTLEDL